MVALNTGFPSGPIVDPATGELTVIGRAFFIALWNRTGAGVGLSSGDAADSIAAETTARQAADVGLTADVSAEGTTRATADSALGARITNEAMIRASADSALQVQMVGANLPAILTEDAITSLKVSAMPAVDTATLAGTELFTATQAGVNAKWTLNSLYTVTAAIGNFLANPLNAAAASNIDGAPVIFQGGAGDTDSNGGGAAFFGGPAAGVGAGGDVGLQGGAGSGTTGSNGGEASVFGGNASGGDSDGGSAVLRGGNSTGTGFAGWATVVGADAAGVGGTAGSVLIQAGSGTTAGQVYVANLPIADPVDGNAVWLDTGVLVLSGSTVGGSFAASDLSGLPSSDPGGGLPWLNGGVLQVGP